MPWISASGGKLEVWKTIWVLFSFSRYQELFLEIGNRISTGKSFPISGNRFLIFGNQQFHDIWKQFPDIRNLFPDTKNKKSAWFSHTGKSITNIENSSPFALVEFFFFFYIGCELMRSSQQPSEVDSPKGSPRLIITYKINFCIGQAKTHWEGRFWFGLSYNTKRSSLANVGNEILLIGRTRRPGYLDAFMLHCTILRTPPTSSVGSHHSSLNPATASNAFSCNFAENGHKNSIQL